jgi:SAM-dependent methyltransferase
MRHIKSRTLRLMPTRLRQRLQRTRGPQPIRELIELSPEDHRYLTTLYDDSTPLPESAAELHSDSARLKELRDAYAALDLPVVERSRWSAEAVEKFLDLRFFRGETLITWHYRELPRITKLKYFVFMTYVEERDKLGLLDKLDEDGAYGCWTYEYPGYGRYSRDLIESVNEIAFLERELALSKRGRFSVLDVGAGYGRLAHRITGAYGSAVSDYACVDAIPESTFVCEHYLRERGIAPPARAVPLHEQAAALEPGSFDLALNVHSFSECTLAAIEWWVERLAELRVQNLMIIPNEPTELLSLEQDKSRRDFMPALEAAGYELVKREPVIRDEAVRELLKLDDHFHLFRL